MTTSPPPLGPPSDPAAASQPATDHAGKSRGDRDPRTRTGTTWFGICVAAVLLVVLIVFMLQNTGSVEVTFLGMHGNLPLAMALLVAAVGAAIVTMAIGAARIVQIRRQSRHRQP
ncbi:LapA family protein [Dactylosporangium matsuzakiense]|uniref:Lipopolysaccharide assembly protein A domain-containing protein n=1 Tax=Dactylosporangium matsuzakiense TaxID=53360 RepID=A0A9W6NQ72_9ACTN|nr:lipopolysaccharide assembly protein LapA domain-containing protein [Dactylosporangium matsuzakiense]GLL05905.1 hypothetical protein GCM10017581_076530 [Dactylosporangium matsuzakiense]